jgi:thymidylate kinase
LAEKLKVGEAQGRSNIIIISGIPGAGKTKLAESLTKQLSAEGVPSFNFKSPGHISENVKFSTSKFIQQVIQ